MLIILFEKGWKKADKMTRSPNICAMIDRFNLVSGWVSTEVVKYVSFLSFLLINAHYGINRAGEPKARANIIAKFINVAEVRILKLMNKDRFADALSNRSVDCCKITTV